MTAEPESSPAPDSSGAIVLADVQRVLALFAEGVAGRYYHVKTTSEIVSGNLSPSEFESSHDAHSIYLPETLGHFEDPSANAAIYRLMILQQLGFREFGTYDFDIATARSRIPSLAQRELPTHYRESDLEVFFKHFEYPLLVRSLFHAIESARVERRMLALYPGAKRYRRSLQEVLDAQFDPFMTGVAGELNMLRGWLNGVADAHSPLVDQAEGIDGPDADVYTSAAAAVACYLALESLIAVELVGAAQEELLDDAPPMEWLQRQARLEDWEEDLQDMNLQLASFELAEDMQGKEVEVGDADQGDGTIRETGLDLTRERDQTQRRIDMERSAVRHALGDDRANTRSFLYDEWDYHNQTYLRGWCRLFEERLTSDEGTDALALVESVKPLARAVRRQFEQVRPAGYQRLNKVPDGDELYLNAVIDARADMRVGNSPDERVYSRRERMRRDVGAVFLVDLSASTDDPIEEDEKAQSPPPDPDAPAQNLRDPYPDEDDEYPDLESRLAEEAAKRRIIDIQREAVVVMATALERLGDQYAVYGFSGYGADCVEFYVAKEFNQSLDKRALDAIAAMKPKRSTRMGPAIRHAVRKLEASGTALKVLMIVSDGFPQDCDYGPDRGDHEYGVQDTARALREAENVGVHTFCVTVDRSGHDYLRRMCPDDQYMVIEETDELPEALQKAYRRLTHI